MTIEDAYQALMLRRTLDASAISSVTAHSAGRYDLDSAGPDQSWRDTSVSTPAVVGLVPDVSSPLVSASAFSSRSSRPVAGRLVMDDTSAWSDALPTPTSVATTPATAAGAAAVNTTAVTAAASPSTPASSCFSLSSLPGGVHAALGRASGDAAAMARALDELAVQTAAATHALRPAAAAAAAPSGAARSPSTFSAASSSLPATPSCCSDVSVGRGRQRRQPRRAPPRAVIAAAAVAAASASASATRDGHDADVARMARHAERIALDEASHALYQAELVSSLYEKRTVRDRVFHLWREQVAVAAFRRRVALARALREWRRATAARCHRRYAAMQARRHVDPLWAGGASPARPLRERAMVRGEAASWRSDPVCVRYRSAAGVVAEALRRDSLASTEQVDRTPRGMSVASPLTASPAAAAVVAEVAPVETASVSGAGGISDSVLSASVLDSTGSPAPRRRSPFPMPCLDTSPRAATHTRTHTAVASSYRYVPSDSSTEGAEVTKVQDEADWEVPDITEGMQKAYSMAACSAFVDVMEAKVLHSALLRWKARTAHARRRQTILQV
eukprot:Rhum_TRINITY_DN14934_c10_g1::Rhum_TRINITY_DN14934_c10_g1_i1::g.129349::m.129349